MDVTVSMASMVVRSRLGVQSNIVSFVAFLSTNLEYIHQSTGDLLDVEGEGVPGISSWSFSSCLKCQLMMLF